MKEIINSKPLVSVIIIFLNAERFIEEAIESVFAQTYTNWELLLVDDGSSDMSTDIALRYAKQYSRITAYIEHKNHSNLGMSISRNVGLKHAKGKYIAILDSDDIWMHNKLEVQVKILESRPDIGIVYGPVLFWHSWEKDNNNEDDFISDLPVEPESVVEPPSLIAAYHPLSESHPPCLSNILVRKNILEKIGGFEEIFGKLPYGLCDDLPFFIKIHLIAKVFITYQCLTKYRIHKLSALSFVMKSKKYHEAELFFLNWLKNFLIQNNIKDQTVWKSYKKAYKPHDYPVLTLLERIYLKIYRSIKWKTSKLLIIFKRTILEFSNREIGALKADPNPIMVNLLERFPVLTGKTTLSWTLGSAKTIEVHVDSPNGPLFSRSSLPATEKTGKWVRDGMTFYLQDVTNEKSLNILNTIDAIKINVLNRDNI